MIEQEPELERRAILYTGTLPHVYVPYNRGECFPIANDPDGLQGLDPSLAIVDEIGFQPIESWDSLRLAQGKRERSTVLGVGTPGFDRDNALFHVRKAIKEGAKLPGVSFTEYAAPEGCPISDRRAWRKANPAIGAGFLRESALTTDLAITQVGHFQTFRLGQWIDGVECWLGPSGRAVWEGLTSPWDFEDGAPTWLGVDVAIRHDTSAVVAIQKRPDGRYHATCRIWVPTDERPIDITDVMQHIRDLAERYSVQAVSFDPRFMDVPAKYLADEGIVMVEVPQTPERMTVACGGAYELIMRGGLTHDGDEAFATQVLNAVPRFSERGFILEKGKSRGKIDAAIGLALAYERVHRTEAVPDFNAGVAFG
jgi:phage terminase large subunit-like protein